MLSLSAIIEKAKLLNVTPVNFKEFPRIPENS